jgi:hypothetical protein
MAGDPIRIVPLSGQAPEAPAAQAALTYRGGELLTDVEVFTLFWGAGWQRDTGLVDQINRFFDATLVGPLIDQLAEYSVPGMSIRHGTRTGTSTITEPVPPASVADADIQQFLRDRITAGVLPQPGTNSLYFVYLDSGVTVSLGGAASCSNFCGYHEATDGGIVYAVMPYPDCASCEGGLQPFDALTSTSSHELCEAITDPIPGTGWYADQKGEIGDICAWQTKSSDGYTVQMEWSNSAGQCV